MKNGLLITLEGPEGCGKTTQCKLLYDYLKQKKYSVIKTREPGGTLLGENIRNILLNPDYKNIDILCELFLYNAARAQLLKEIIKPSLKSGKIIICDRFFDATLAYQGYGRDIPKNIIYSLDKIILRKILPDLTIVFDIDPEDGLKRALKTKDNKIGDRLEQESLYFHQKVREGYLSIAKSAPKRTKLIPSSQSIEKIHKIVCTYVEKLLAKKVKEEFGLINEN
ncbi:MAG: dTMP kinase [bacterium]|nr:dTMP kinase [bacterium]